MQRIGLMAMTFFASWLAAAPAGAAEPLSVSPGAPPQAGSAPAAATAAASGVAPATRRAPVRRPAATAGSLSGANGPDCAALRRQYQQSQECFAPYRLANGGLKPEAAQRCKVVANPSPQCGPLIGK